jgi:hypothetical protein
VGRGSAVDALDRGPEVVGVAVDGGQGRRQRSGEGLSSGKKIAVEKKLLHGISRSGSSCWACLKAKRCTTHMSRSWRRRQCAWQLGRRRCDVEEAGAGQRGVGKVAARQGRTRGRAQSGAGVARALHMAGRAAAVVGRRESRGGRGWRRKKGAVL